MKVKLEKLGALLLAAARVRVERFVERLKSEPVLVRSIIAGALTYLVASGLIDTGLAETVETVAVVLVDGLLLRSARAKVIPEANVEAVTAGANATVDPAP